MKKTCTNSLKRNSVGIRMMKFMLLSALALFTHFHLAAQTSGHQIRGVVYETHRGQIVPLAGAVVGIPDYSVYTTTNPQGEFRLTNVQRGEVKLHISLLGKLPVDTVLNVANDMNLSFFMQEDNFRVAEIVVTATENKAGQATSSHISRTAMEHLQPSNIRDVMMLVPGTLLHNQQLTNVGQLSLRAVPGLAATDDNTVTGDVANMNAMGVTVIQDGSPTTNNSNLNSRNPMVIGATEAMGHGANGSGGVDVRSISMDNVESVEVIRGIASAEYGDATSGFVVIKSKAGREPLRVSAKANPNLYQFSAGAGHKLLGGGKKDHGINYNIDYAHNTNNILNQYRFYERITSKILYSTTHFKESLRSNYSVDFIFGNNAHRQNPDDEKNLSTSRGKERGIKFNTNGTFNINKGWFKSVEYVGSISYKAVDNYSQSQYSSAASSYSLTTTDGAILSNIPGEILYDSDGNPITNPTGQDLYNYANQLNSVYVGRFQIESREVSYYAKLKANFYKSNDIIANRIIVGADFKSDGNEGKGVTYSNYDPPQRSTAAPYASFRQRDYSDIPYINQLGIFLEDNFSLNLGERKFNVQAGLRYDNVSASNTLIAPRVNASLDIVPRHFNIRGGYGVSGKAPNLTYLYPQNAYFEYTNLNNLALDLGARDSYLVTTTRAFDTRNYNLDIAKNQKSELGFDINYKKYRLSVTAFTERMNNGYKMTYALNGFHLSSFNNYVYNQTTKEIDFVDDRSVLLRHATPTNSLVINTKGIEYDLNLGRFDAIRTAVAINGAWMQTESYVNDYIFYYRTSTAADSHVGVFEGSSQKEYSRRVLTTLRLTHNIPELGFVVTLTTQALWRTSNWYKFTDHLIPVKYISMYDGQLYDFPMDRIEEPEFSYLVYDDTNFSGSQYRSEKFKPMYTFNINVTKEIGDWMRASFYANNMFRNYPLSKSSVGNNLIKRGTKFFFGVELSLTFK